MILLGQVAIKSLCQGDHLDSVHIWIIVERQLNSSVIGVYILQLEKKFSGR